MKRHTFALILAACTTLLNGCQTKKEKAFQSSEGVREVVNRLTDAFGKTAHYTDITISYVKGVGSTISATGTNDPTSTKHISKLHSGGEWEDVSEVTLELSGGAKPSDFLFTLDEVDQLKKVPEMVKVAIEKVKQEKKLDVVAEHVSVKYPSRRMGPDDGLGFDVNLAPENGGTSFIAVFDGKGNYQRLVY